MWPAKVRLYSVVCFGNFFPGLVWAWMIVCFWSPIRVNPQCAVGGWLAAVWPKHRGGEGGFLYFVTAAELACFHNFCRHLLTNPVRYISCLKQLIRWLDCLKQILSDFGMHQELFGCFSKSMSSKVDLAWLELRLQIDLECEMFFD